MLYGEVYAPRIDPCVDEHFNSIDCIPGSWFVPVVMTIYLLGTWNYYLIMVNPL